MDNASAVFCANMPSWNRTMLTHGADCTAKDKDYPKCIPYLKNREMPPLHPDAPQAASDHWNLVVTGCTETQVDEDAYLVQYLNESNLALGSLSAASGRHPSIPDSHRSFKQSDTVFMYPRNLVDLMKEFILTMFWIKRPALISFSAIDILHSIRRCATEHCDSSYQQIRCLRRDMTQRIDNLKDMKMPAGTRDVIFNPRLLFLMAWTKGSHFALTRYHKFRKLPSTPLFEGNTDRLSIILRLTKRT